MSLTFVPRVRSSLEALDLGLGLLQAHRGPVLRVFFFQLALALGLMLPFTWKQPAWSLLGLLWLSPWLDRGTLHVLSRRVFGQEAGLRTFLADWSPTHRGLVGDLLWKRLSPASSFLLPVRQLEGLRGREASRRGSVLLRGVGGTAFLLALTTLVCLGLTLFGILGLLQILAPKPLGIDLWAQLASGLAQPAFAWCFTAFGLLALALVEPFFAAAGFALYLQRRTELEAWDLEQVFRRLAARLRSGLLLLLLGVSATAGPPAAPSRPAAAPSSESLEQEEVPPEKADHNEPDGADSPDSQSAQKPPASPPGDGPLRPEDPARKELEAILGSDPDFFRHKTEHRLEYRPTGSEPAWLRTLLDGLFGPSKPREASPSSALLGQNAWTALAWILRLVLVVLLLVLAVWILRRVLAIRGGGLRKAAPPEAPTVVAGLDIRPESLPADLVGEARARFQAGEAREALALLYRGALVALVHRHRTPIPASATEGDCLVLAQSRLPEEALGAFRVLTGTWSRRAYRGEAPSPADFDALAETLLKAWPDAFPGGKDHP